MRNPELLAPPQPDQMFEIAAIGVCVAREQDKLRESSKVDNAHYFLPKYLDESEFTNGKYRATTHSFIGRVAKLGYGRDRSWTMHLIEKFWAIEDGMAEAIRTTHSFSWDKQQVTRANRTIQQGEGFEEVIDANQFMDDGITVLYPSIEMGLAQMAVVSQADCRKLARDLRQFSDSSQKVLHYNR